MENQLTQSVVPYNCPNCQTPLHVCLGFEAGLLWVITNDQMLANKAKLKELLKAVAFKTKEAEEATFKYIDSPDFVLGENDIDEVARGIIKNQE